MTKAEIVGARGVRFDLAGSNDRELPLILGLMPVLPEHAIDPATFEETTFEPLLGSGPYRVERCETRSQRHPRAQSRLLGQRPADQSRPVEFRRGPLRLSIATPTRISRRSRKVSTTCAPRPIRGAGRPAMTFRRCADGRIVKEEFTDGLPKGMYAFVFNTRRPIFADIRVREAIAMLFDFEWVNHNFFFDRYRRTASYYDGSELASAGPLRRRARARAARAISRRGARRHSRRRLGAAGHRRLRPRPPDLEAGARAARSGGLRTCTARSCCERNSGKPLAFEILVTTPRSGAARPCFYARPQARRHCRAPAQRRRGSIRPAAAHLRFRYDPEPLGSSRCRPATSRPSTGARPPPTPTAHATIWASRVRRSTP